MKNFIKISSEETWACIAPYIHNKIDFTKLKREIDRRSLRDSLKKILYKSKLRNEDGVRLMYDKKWSSRNPEFITAYEGGLIPINWDSKNYVVDGLGFSNLQTLRIIKLIEKIKPNSVLDVGCGNGERLLQLACIFPKINFYGLELAQKGVEAAKNIQKQEKISQVLIDSSPKPLLDLSAHKKIEFINASAKKIPYEDNSFDLVYTSLALEQMELFRKQALQEIHRVTKEYSSLYEAFKDYNSSIFKKAYIYSEGYFKGSLKDLNSLGYEIVEAVEDIPQKTYMNATFTILKKIR